MKTYTHNKSIVLVLGLCSFIIGFHLHGSCTFGVQEYNEPMHNEFFSRANFSDLLNLSVTGTITITESGYYQVQGTLEVSAGHPDPIITIDADDVFVSLASGKLIGQGIVITGTHNNILIQGGSIMSSPLGIQVGNNCSNVCIDSMLITDTTGVMTCGIQVQADCSDVHILNSLVRDPSIAGIECSDSSNVIVKRSVVMNANSANNASGGGIIFNNMSNSLLHICTVNGAQQRGFLITGTSTLMYNEMHGCLSCDNTGVGFQVDARATCMADCSACRNTSHGFALYGPGASYASDNNSLIGCLSKFNGGAGYYAGSSAQDNVIDGCKALNNTTDGFYDVNSTGTNKYTNNTAGSNGSTPSTDNYTNVNDASYIASATPGGNINLDA